MTSLRPRFEVRFAYDVHFTTGVFDPANPLLADVLRGAGETAAGPHKAVLVVDAAVWEAHPNLDQQARDYAAAHAGALAWTAPPLVVPGGEACKNDPAVVDRIRQAIHDGGVCRHSYLVAVGGGAVIDAAGFAAATAHRGVRLIRVPTTVLAQNDAAVGVKNSVNAFGKKNFLGTFAPPVAVLNDDAFLATLDDRDWRAGIAEAVKVALLKDAAFFERIDASAGALRDRDPRPMRDLIRRCAELHLEHIATSGDPFELGSSRPLDFGHWAAHKLEQLTAYRLRHGEAVAIGLALDCTYSHLMGWLPAEGLERILSTLERAGLPTYAPELERRLGTPGHPGSLFHGLTEFQEHLGGTLTIMLLDGIGRGREVHDVDLDVYSWAVKRLRCRHAHRRPASLSAPARSPEPSPR